MKTLKEQTDAKIAKGRSAKPEFMQNVDQIIDEQKKYKKGELAVKIGDVAPNFVLPNAEDHSISLEEVLIKGPVVVTFYRGSWCPYCNLQLRAMQDVLPEIHSLGAQLIAISPEVPDGSLSPNEISKMNFIVLSDQDAKIAKKYGVAWKVPEYLLDHMRVDRKLNLELINNGNTDVLPIPATFIINTDGRVVWRFVDVDYRNRSEPSEIIDMLKKMSS